MFDKNYYYLVSGLKEYFPDSETKGFDAPAIIEEIREGISKSDRRTLTLFYDYYDIENITNLRRGRSRFSEMGNLSREELQHELSLSAQDDSIDDDDRSSKLPSYIKDVLAAYDRSEDDEPLDEDDENADMPLERALFAAYYKKCAKSSSRFLRRWAEFDRTLRNVSAAIAARKKGMTAAEALVGDDDVVTALSRSSAADFGLRGEVDYMDQVIAALGDDVNIMDKEKRMDDIRWEMSDDLTVREYFSMDYLLGYLVKVNIVYRWASLDPDTGNEMLTRLVDALTGSEILGTLSVFDRNNKTTS